MSCDPLPRVMADEVQLMSLFQNLIGNGLKFRSEQSPHIHVSARQSGHQWVFSVTDNGMGIEPQYFDRIFVIFQRLHGKTEYPGTGIRPRHLQKDRGAPRWPHLGRVRVGQGLDVLFHDP